MALRVLSAGVRADKQNEEKMAGQTMTGAFADLNGLMAKAKEMVRSTTKPSLASRLSSLITSRLAFNPSQVALAGSISTQAAKTDGADAETTELGSIMANVGIDNPVTK